MFKIKEADYMKTLENPSLLELMKILIQLSISVAVLAVPMMAAGFNASLAFPLGYAMMIFINFSKIISNNTEVLEEAYDDVLDNYEAAERKLDKALSELEEQKAFIKKAVNASDQNYSKAVAAQERAKILNAKLNEAEEKLATKADHIKTLSNAFDKAKSELDKFKASVVSKEQKAFEEGLNYISLKKSVAGKKAQKADIPEELLNQISNIENKYNI